MLKHNFIGFAFWLSIGGCSPDKAPSSTDDTASTYAPRCGDGTIDSSLGEDCDDAGESASCDLDCTLAACGDGTLNVTSGEDCDEGETALCDLDCTLTQCGDGTLNLIAGEECDDPEDPENCLEDCTTRVGNCHIPTPWDEIADSLFDHDLNGLLPVLPGDNIDPDWGLPTPEFVSHKVTPDERFPDDELPLSDSCEPPSFWDPARVELGGYVVPESEDEEPYCRIRASSTRTTDNGLYFANRARDANNSSSTGEPTWVKLRFPIPENHQATELTYSVNWSRLLGSHPEECTGDDVDEFGECILYALDETEEWDEEIPAGLYLLWGRATDCEGWAITGPHEPAGTMSWSDHESFTVQVPESLRTVDELVVSLLVYHQYPGGCEGTVCYSGKYVHSNLGFGGASLTTEAAFSPNTEPPLEHPRLFGDNATWLATNAAFDTLPCYGEPDWSEGSTFGGLTNIRNTWDQFTKGGAVCLDEVPETLWEIDDAAAYLDGTAAESFDVNRAARLLHMIRHERACRSTGLATCYHDETEIEELAAAMIAIEMARIRDVDWNTHGFDFDLRTREPMRVYTLLADVLWDDLSSEQHAEILDVTGEQVDGFFEHFYEPHWSIYNGNNWTPVLTEAALYWAIVYYHEDPRAPELAWRALQILWLHRDFYLDDGVYKEGLMMYSQVSFDPLMVSSRLAEHAFGLHLESIPWEQMEAFSAWAMAMMGPDARTIDFGDSWSKKGWATFMPLVAHMIDEADGDVTADPDPCFAHRFFSNKYYYHGLQDPWNVHPALARDWPTILGECEATDGMIPVGAEVRTWDEGGWGSIRIGQAGATEVGSADPSDAPSRHKQADQVMLAISAIPNSFSHTEMDFGTFVWIPYTNRLIWDFGYGTLHNDRYQTSPDYPPDQNPAAHSTLVIPEAHRDGDSSTNTSQIDGRDGSIETVTVDGYSLILLDGSTVYGRDDPALGWLEHFHRRVLPLESGHMILMDDFMVRSDRGTANVAEYWYTQPWEEVPDTSACRDTMTSIQRTVTEDAIELVPICSGLDYAVAESAGRILATSLNPGAFEDEGEISFIDRLNNENTKVRLSWKPDAPVSRDLRLFALIAAPGEEFLPSAEWSWGDDCGADLCATLSIDGEDPVHLGFSDDGTRYSLVSISE